jgi:hypothetical protein
MCTRNLIERLAGGEFRTPGHTKIAERLSASYLARLRAILTRPFLRPDLIEAVLVKRQQPALGDLPALDAEDANGLPLDGPTIALSLASSKEHCSLVVRKYVANVDSEGAPPELSPLVEVVDDIIFPHVITRDCTSTWHLPRDVVRQHDSDSFNITAGIKAAEGFMEVPNEPCVRVHSQHEGILPDWLR